MDKVLKYAQDPVSVEFKAVLKNRIQSVWNDEMFEALLNDIHDAVLRPHDDPDRLRAAVRFLKGD